MNKLQREAVKALLPMRLRGCISKTPEHSGRFRRKPLSYAFLRRGVSRNLAAPNPPQGVPFFSFSLFLFFLFSF